MATVMSDTAQPMSSGEINLTDPDRYEDVERKHQRVAEFLLSNQYDGVLIRRRENIAWFTSGGECPRVGSDEAAAAIFVTPDARVVIANNIDAPQLFDKQWSGLGFQLKQRPWHEDRQALLDDVCRGRVVASDCGLPGTKNESQRLAAFRRRLEPVECERMRTLGAAVAHAVEATARHVEPGQTEAEIAGHLSHRLIKHEVHPRSLRVAADGRSHRYPHWNYSDQPLQKWCVIAAVGSRWGLHCAAARVVFLGSAAPEQIAAFQAASMLEATGMFFTQAGIAVSTIWQKVQRIYEKVGHGDEWQQMDQADLIGYTAVEQPLLPAADWALEQRMAVHWHPSVTGMQTGDTVLIGEKGLEFLTKPTDWPQVCVTVKGQAMFLPDLLIREPGMRA